MAASWLFARAFHSRRMALSLAPALRAARSDLNLELKTGGRTDDSIRNRARNLLIIAEIALSLILLVCAGLLIQSFERLQSVNPGFGLEQTLAVRLSLPPSNSTRPVLRLKLSTIDSRRVFVLCPA